MGLARTLRHFLTGDLALRRAFPAAALERIEAAIRAGESRHRGEIRFAVEASLLTRALLQDVSARQRAIQVFSQIGVWDTQENNGVLIYLLLADRDVEIVADRGANRAAGHDAWEAVCRDMEAAFRAGRFEQGVVAGVQAVSALLAEHYPARGSDSNELSDRPVIL